jgi:hypothetical protein
MYLALETLQNNFLRVAMGPKLSGELLTLVKLFYFLARVGETSGGYRKKSKKNISINQFFHIFDCGLFTIIASWCYLCKLQHIYSLTRV